MKQHSNDPEATSEINQFQTFFSFPSELSLFCPHSHRLYSSRPSAPRRATASVLPLECWPLTGQLRPRRGPKTQTTISSESPASRRRVFGIFGSAARLEPARNENNASDAAQTKFAGTRHLNDMVQSFTRHGSKYS